MGRPVWGEGACVPGEPEGMWPSRASEGKVLGGASEHSRLEDVGLEPQYRASTSLP